LSKDWSPKDLRGTKHLLKEHRGIEDARIAKNAAAGDWLPYKPGWSFAEFRDDEIPKLNPYRLAVDEFETPDDRHGVWWIGVHAKDYGDASEEPGRVTVRSSNCDIEQPEVFSPYDATVKYNEANGVRRRRLADEEDTIGLDTDLNVVEKMTDAIKAWVGMTTPPSKAPDHTVEALVLSYPANGGTTHTCGDYKTTPRSEIRFRTDIRPEWAGGTGIPPELRNKKKLFRVEPKTGSKHWSNTV
jgi:hypothetical protein